jgi:hypothetical protein
MVDEMRFAKIIGKLYGDLTWTAKNPIERVEIATKGPRDFVENMKSTIEVGENILETTASLEEPTGDMAAVARTFSDHIYPMAKDNLPYLASGALGLWATHNLLNKDLEETRYRKATRIGKSVFLYGLAVLSLYYGIKNPTNDRN